MNKQVKEKLIHLAMKEAEKAIKKGDSPYGAIFTDSKGNVLFKAHNAQNTLSDSTAHAEINLLRKAGKKIELSYFKNFYLFCNAESCTMCMSACVKRNITHFFFGAPSEKIMNPYITPFDIAKKSKKKLHIETGILKNECMAQIERGKNNLLKQR